MANLFSLSFSACFHLYMRKHTAANSLPFDVLQHNLKHTSNTKRVKDFLSWSKQPVTFQLNNQTIITSLNKL